MASKKKKVIPYKRKRNGRTNYKVRLKLLLSRKPRLVVRKSNTKLVAQIVEYVPSGDKIISAAVSTELKKYGWSFSLKNIPSAYLLGVLIAKKALDKKVNHAIFDIGSQRSNKGSKLYAVLNGAIDAGMSIPADNSIFPSKDRVSGKHIAGYFSSAAGNQFSNYKKEKLSVQSMEKQIEEIKHKILAK
ncbi:50S ribosomal protein L18 [Candidatus Woesearchaeota archaeon]|nr:MAG: 50S ribosomal protein L18 [Candidatus Woesearchaeota archaeon]